MTKDHGPQIKDDDTYEELKKQGESKEKAARIANAKENKNQHPSKKGGKSSVYEDRTKEELQDKAKEIGIKNYSQMNKEELINALRHH